METQLVYHHLGQWEPSFGIRPDKPSDFLLPHHDAEPTFPIHHDAVLTLIGCASEVTNPQQRGDRRVREEYRPRPFRGVRR